MRIYLTADVVGGVWDFASTLANGLVAEGHDVRLAVIGTPQPDRLHSLNPAVDLTSADFSLEWMPGGERDIDEAANWIAHDAARWGSDLIHFNQMTYSARGFDTPAVVTVHSDVLSWFAEAAGEPAPAEWDGYADRVRRGLQAADLVVAPSVYQSELTRRHYGRGADRVIYNAIDFAVPGAPTRNRAPTASFNIMSAGRAWDRAKGMDVLERAAAALHGHSIIFDVFGDTAGPGGERFEAQHLTLHGRVSRARLHAALVATDAYVAASRYEPFGLAPLEAARARVPLILTDIPSFRELWDGCAEFFPKDDPAALADLIIRLRKDPARLDRLGESAHDHARRCYAMDRFIEEHLNLYGALQPCA